MASSESVTAELERWSKARRTAVTLDAQTTGSEYLYLATIILFAADRIVEAIQRREEG